MRMRLLFLLFVLLPILLGIADAASKKAKPSNSRSPVSQTPASHRGPRRTFREFQELLNDDNIADEETQELDDEGDDEDDDDYDDDYVADDSGAYAIPNFEELFPNPAGLPAGPTSYGTFLNQIPNVKKLSREQQAKEKQQDGGHSPSSPVRRNEPRPDYSDDDASRPPRKGRKPKPRRPPPPPPPPQGGSYYQDQPPQQQGGNYYPGPQQQGGNYYQGPPPQQQGGNYYQGPPPQQQGGNYYQGPPQSGHGPQYHTSSEVEDPRPIFDYFPGQSLLGSLFGKRFQKQRADLPEIIEEEDDVPLPASRTLLESDEVEAEPEPQKSERASPVRRTHPLYNRHGYKTQVRPGFGTNKYYAPKTQQTRYFRPISNRIYTDYAYSPQGAFVMPNYRPSYRPRLENSLEPVPVSRRSGSGYGYSYPVVGHPLSLYYVPVPSVPDNRLQSARYFPFKQNALVDSYNPEYVVKPSEMLTRRNFRYHPSQTIQSGHWDNPRNNYVNPQSGAEYHSSYLGAQLF